MKIWLIRRFEKDFSEYSYYSEGYWYDLEDATIFEENPIPLLNRFKEKYPSAAIEAICFEQIKED
jgi:hypothetical protein